MLVRVRSRDGNFRFELQPTDDISALISKILETSALIDPDTLALSNQPRGGENLVSTIQGDLATLGISHGDLLFASYSQLSQSSTSAAPAPAPTQPTTASTLSGKVVPIDSQPSSSTANGSSSESGPSTSTVTSGSRPWEQVTPDDVDKYYEGKNGQIGREKGKNGCRCGPKSMCDYCMPLEPYDAAYQAEHAIKHLSFHAHLRKLTSSAPPSTASASFIPPLSSPSYKVVVPCSSGSHPSWPAGICTKCQPSAVTLSRQTWRMVDHVEFASPAIIDSVLSFWRQTGQQRFGYLLGRFEPYEKVPMGVKAVVEAVHEPPQEPHPDGISVGFPWDDEGKVAKLAEACGLHVVGCLFTDLTADKEKQGQVLSKRHANSFFLSSLEVLFAAQLQRSHPTPSRFADSGKFSSRFVTCVVSGDVEGSIAVEAYQVSDQAMAMVEADMVEPSVDPGIVRVKDEGATRYIPEVYYSFRNKYNLQVKESAKPCFPVEYLIVNVTNGFPLQPSPLFTSKDQFTIENRAGLQDQTMGKVAASFAAAVKTIPSDLLTGQEVDLEGLSAQERMKLGPIAEWLADWHLLSYLDNLGIFTEEETKLMASIARSKDTQKVAELLGKGGWQTFMILANEEAPKGPSQAAPTHFDDGFEIPPDLDVPPELRNDLGQGGGGGGDYGDFDMGAAGGSGAATPGGAGGGGGAEVSGVCPHCTFENEPGTRDCEVCGLPLSG